MTLTPEQANAMTVRLAGHLDGRRNEIAMLNGYYAGKQPLRFASDKWRENHQKRYDQFSDNWCGVVANSPAERLHVTGFRLPSDEKSPVTADERVLWDDWLRNDLDAQSSQGFLAGIVAKRSYALVWVDPDDLETPMVTWEDPSCVVVDYDPEHFQRRRAALKVWESDELEFATLFTAGEVWKWQRRRISTSGLIVKNDGAWLPRDVTGDDVWPIRNPLGVVPVVEFANRPMLGGEPLSDIAGTVAMQDAINLLWAYLFNAADYASMPARVILGAEPPMMPVLDATGQVVGSKPVPQDKLEAGRFLWLSGQTAKVDQFDPAKLDVFTEVIETAVGHIAAQTRTPPHYLVANKGLSNLSGDALKAAETGLVKKVEEQQLFLSPSVREVFRLLALVRGDDQLAAAVRSGSVRWKDAESRSESQMVDGLQKLSVLGFPFRWIAERYGLSETEIARLMQLREAETADPLIASLLAPQAPSAPGG